MLTKLEIENFKSFKNRTIFNFESTNYKILKNTNVTKDGILKGAIFAGGNGSGKTNIVLALRILLDLLFKERRIDLATYKCLFSESHIMNLEYSFRIEGKHIEYQIEYDIKGKMLAEKLFIDEELMLERIGDTGKSYFTEAKHFRQNKETLALRTIYFNTGFYEYPILRKWLEYLLNSVYLEALMTDIMEHNHASVGLKEYLEENGPDKINDFFDDYNFQYKIRYQDANKSSFMEMDYKAEKNIFFKRRGVSVPIPFYMESLGNRNLLHTLPAFLMVIENGGMLIIDEFNSSFHNELEELLIRFFMNKAKGGQIFLVSHSTNLLSNTIFRPDQEYAVAFQGEEGSLINRFSNEKPREAQNIEKMYNSGIFGGKPKYDR